MNCSRALAVTKACTIFNKGLLNKSPLGLALKQQSRQSGAKYFYREAPKIKKEHIRRGQIINGMMWWWILWHLFTEYEELLGFYTPDPAKWTDEELGIPKD